MSNSLDPDQGRRIVRSDLGPNCLPRLSTDDTGRQRVNKTGVYKDIHLNQSRTNGPINAHLTIVQV